MQKFKKYIKKRFPNFYEILFIFYNFILLRRKNNIKFDGLGLRTSISVPWDRILKNKTSVGFINAKKKLDTKIRSKEFILSIIENYYSNSSLDDTFDHYEELNFRHYVIYYSSLLAFENTESKNAVECGSADGMGVYFCISNYIKDKKSKIYLYDSWETMRDKELKTEKDLTRKGDYHYLDEKIIKNNLEEFSKFIIYNKGFIPETFEKSKNPDNLSWLHIDLNSSMPTLESLKFFYPRLEKNGIILLDDYGFDQYYDTKIIAENFFENKKVDFLQFMTGQAMIIKRE